MKIALNSNLLKIYLFRFFSNFGFVSAVLVPFFTIWGGLNLTKVMILQAWFLIWVFILEVPTGAIADYFGRKWSLILGAMLSGIAAFVYASYPNFYVFLLGEFLWAIAAALISGADEAFLYDTLREIKREKDSKKIISTAHIFGLAGILISAPIGSVIAQVLGLRAPMLLMTIPAFIAFLVGLTLKEPKIKEKLEKKYFRIISKGIIYFKDHKILKILALDFIFISAIGYFMIWFYQPLLLKAGISIGYFGIIHAGLVFSQIIILAKYKLLEKIFGSKRKLLFISALIPGIMFILGGLTTIVPLILIVVLFGGGFALGRGPLLSNYMNKYIPSNKRATVLSTVSMFHTLGLAIVSPILGRLADWSLNYTFIIIGVITLIFVVFSKIEEDMLID